MNFTGKRRQRGDLGREYMYIPPKEPRIATITVHKGLRGTIVSEQE